MKTKERKIIRVAKLCSLRTNTTASRKSKVELLSLSAQQCRQAVVMKQIFLSFFSFLLLPPDSDASIESLSSSLNHAKVSHRKFVHVDSFGHRRQSMMISAK